MKASFRKPQAARVTLCAAIAVTLAACGGGGSNSPSASSNAPAATAPASLSGTVAVGRAISGAHVTVIDATGKRVGNY